MAVGIKINGVQHVGVPVTDLGVSVAFYAELGFEVVMDDPFVHEGGSGRWCMVQRDNIIIELYQMPETELADIRSTKNGHIDHIAFEKPGEAVYIR